MIYVYININKLVCNTQKEPRLDLSDEPNRGLAWVRISCPRAPSTIDTISLNLKILDSKSNETKRYISI